MKMILPLLGIVVVVTVIFALALFFLDKGSSEKVRKTEILKELLKFPVHMLIFTISLFLYPIWMVASGATTNPTEISGQAQALALTANMKWAHKVEPLEVKTLPDNKAKVVAMLTYPDGTTAKCEYLMRVKVVKAGEQNGFQYLPLSEKCAPASK
ncbi:hypothetical protein QU487_06570 [Crenobacter sp. SG2305]|uniref:hypothetical protein n=1 Tax=Crenobacter oryzisoli TaxID=3056844 RepID=UPI0025AA90F5|nr:hypothetical protein [Crenobacter sp. SG2305]MDN0082417.1 hypothetical protein [Crenobacter sp. SG2305]